MRRGSASIDLGRIYTPTHIKESLRHHPMDVHYPHPIHEWLTRMHAPRHRRLDALHALQTLRHRKRAQQASPLLPRNPTPTASPTPALDRRGRWPPTEYDQLFAEKVRSKSGDARRDVGRALVLGTQNGEVDVPHGGWEEAEWRLTQRVHTPCGKEGWALCLEDLLE